MEMMKSNGEYASIIRTFYSGEVAVLFIFKIDFPFNFILAFSFSNVIIKSFSINIIYFFGLKADLIG